MIVLDEGTGRVRIDWPEPVVIEPPTVQTWALWRDRVAQIPDETLIGVAGRVTVSMLRSLGHPGPVRVAEWPMWVADPALPVMFLEFWRDYPISPFTARGGDGGGASSIPDEWAHLSPGRFALAQLYRACRVVGLAPEQVNRSAMWELGALLTPYPEERPSAERMRSTGSTATPGFVERHSWSRRAGEPERFAGTGTFTMPGRGAA